MKILTTTLSFILLTVFSTSTVKAQEFNFQKAYQDYLYTFNQYQNAHTEYVAAKSAYETYQTLTAKTEAFDKTVSMLQWRDKTVITYLTALRLKLAETTGISDYEQTVLYLKLDNEIGWYREHSDELLSPGSPEDLFKLSNKAENQFLISEILAYQALSSVMTGKIEFFKQSLQAQIQEVQFKVAEIRQRGDKNTAVLERWLLEAENKLTRVQEKEYEALQIVNKLRPEDADKIDKYTRARLIFKEAGQYLIEADRYLLEIIREVKLAD